MKRKTCVHYHHLIFVTKAGGCYVMPNKCAPHKNKTIRHTKTSASPLLKHEKSTHQEKFTWIQLKAWKVKNQKASRRRLVRLRSSFFVTGHIAFLTYICLHTVLQSRQYAIVDYCAVRQNPRHSCTVIATESSTK